MFTSHDYAFFHGRMLGQHSFNLSELDPIPANLDLIIHAADEFDISIGPITSPVSGSVERRSSPSSEWISDKSFSGQLDRFKYPRATPAPPYKYLAV